MLSNFRCSIEQLGRGNVVVARWQENGVDKNISTIASGTTVEAFGKSVQQQLGLLPREADTPFTQAVKRGECGDLHWRGNAEVHEEPYIQRTLYVG